MNDNTISWADEEMQARIEAAERGEFYRPEDCPDASEVDEVRSEGLSVVRSPEWHRENRIPAPLHHSSADTRLTKWVKPGKTWTPMQGALLVCGFDPATYREKSYGQDIKGATGLCGAGFMGNRYFVGACDIEQEWRSSTFFKERIQPSEFIAWCHLVGIDTGWLSAVAAPVEPVAAPSASAPAVARPEPVAVPAGAPETPAQKRERLQARVNYWRGQGMRDWTARVAREEGVTVARIRQILSSAKPKEPVGGRKKPRQAATFCSGLMAPSGRTR